MWLSCLELALGQFLGLRVVGFCVCTVDNACIALAGTCQVHNELVCMLVMYHKLTQYSWYCHTDKVCWPVLA